MSAKPAPSAPRQIAAFYVSIEPRNIALFRFLLEGYGHVGYMSVLDKYRGLIKVKTTGDCAAALREALGEIRESIAFAYVS